MTSDEMDDAEFEAFLKQEADLSRRLKTLKHPLPSAELDAAILNQVKLALAQETRPKAANDPAIPRLQRSFAVRWRVPGAIAATVLAGVLAHQGWEASNALQAPKETAPAPVEVKIVPQAQVPPSMPAIVAESAAPVPMAAARPAPPPPAPAAEASALRAPAAARAMAGAPAMAPRDELERIEALIKAGQEQEALAAWARFQAAYPAYPVPEPLQATLKALQER
ncbi:MAG: hypothetical protein V4463_03555 [Pseudomonadota bacterium]